MRLVFRSNGTRKEIAGCSERTLAELAADAGFPLNMQCGGQGACRGCTVRLVSGRVGVGGKTVHAPAEVRACQAAVLSEATEVEIPARSLLNIGECASADFYSERSSIFQPLESCEGQFGIAVDIGTTTVAALLVELSSGKILARESAYNRQIELGTDVAARIALCCEAENVEKLRQLIITETLFPMFEKLEAAVSEHWKEKFQGLDSVTEIVFSGNTVMSHLVLGLSALSIGTIPFEPLMKVFREHPASEIGLDCCPNARVRLLPAVAGYVGGDVVSDLYVSAPSGSGVEMLVDIGTNGEIVLMEDGRMIATATAAGPAFEGAGLLHGARAGDGVIEQVICNPDDSMDVEVIGGGPASGLCGSAAIDFMATAFESGLLNMMGRFDLDRLRAAGRLVQLDCHGMTVNACILVPQEESALDEPVMITEYDVSQILKAKGAVYAGIRTILSEAGRELQDVQRLVLAGGFAAHLRIEHAITIGLLPELPLSTYDVIGNGSLAGAYAALGSPVAFDELLNLSRRPSALHLNKCAEFNDRYIDAMALPNMDPDEFPQTFQRTAV
ncbi:ASKHA domain-containing protein [Tichowtungia aerotolerans]|uniref:DUF4445 domain-containing protein n=1 Tax=Tichowtungia aerotolerans TaxID=2697043 RepID=A0A6P1M9X9_9BACT|nr:ASKHA domain-containing protein [Tichowtungia aerotolerans]QHI70641.1 DUF4445 domain-containing protein [Tichowtungia aerotolerans]